jgi:hypothetical protein
MDAQDNNDRLRELATILDHCNTHARELGLKEEFDLTPYGIRTCIDNIVFALNRRLANVMETPKRDDRDISRAVALGNRPTNYMPSNGLEQ